MLSIFYPRCVKCRARGKYTSRSGPPHKLAQEDGWRVIGKGWVCSSCYRKTHGLEGDNEGKPIGIQSIQEAISKRLSSNSENKEI